MLRLPLVGAITIVNIWGMTCPLFLGLIYLCHASFAGHHAVKADKTDRLVGARHLITSCREPRTDEGTHIVPIGSIGGDGAFMATVAALET